MPESVDAEHPRVQAFMALARLATESWTARPSDAAVGRWFSSLDPDLESFFAPVQPVLSRMLGEALSANIIALPDLGTVADFLAAQLLRETDPDSAKRRGAIFTPDRLARFVTRNAVAHWRRLHRSGRQPGIAADLSCGIGVFLAALESEFHGSLRVIGADIDPTACHYAQAFAFASRAAWDVRCTDTVLSDTDEVPLLASSSGTEGLPHLDLLIGNPPFVRSQTMDPRYTVRLRARYPSTRRGNFDLSVAFVENAIERLTDRGIASYILTSKFMSSSYGRLLCERLARDVRVLSVEDFQDHQAFNGYTTYTCVLTFAKAVPAKRFLFTQLSKGIEDGGNAANARTVSLSADRLASHPLDFATGLTQEALSLLRNGRHPLLDHVFGRVLQGLRTGANQVFVMDARTARRIEPSMLVPFVTGEQIRRGRVAAHDLQLLYPYRRTDFGDVVVRSDEEISRDAPRTWAYLCAHRQELEDRSRDHGSPWYAYSRSQNLELVHLRKLLVREMMPRAEFASDPDGEYGFASGNALDASRLTDDALRLWTAVLCTPTLEFALRQSGTQLHSGWFRLLKHHLRRIRLPDFTASDRTKAAIAADHFLEEPSRPELLQRLDDLVADAFGLNSGQRGAIMSQLQDAHGRSLPLEFRASTTPRVQQPTPEGGLLSYEPVRLSQFNSLHRERPELRRSVTFVPNKTIPVHRWYKYTQAFSAEMVLALIKELAVTNEDRVLDPFAGCGTTGLVCRQLGIPSTNLDISPLMAWVARGKVRQWDAPELRRVMRNFSPPPPSKCTDRGYERGPFSDYLTRAFAPGILRQLWSVASYISAMDLPEVQRTFLMLGLLSIMEDVSQIRKHGSHYRFMLRSESIGLQKLSIAIIPPQADIRPMLLSRLSEMVGDVAMTQFRDPVAPCEVNVEDARDCSLACGSI